MQIASHQRLPYVQCLRAAAASGVVLLHAQIAAVRFYTWAPIIPSEIAEIGR